MPTASSSRKRIVRRNNSSDIEADKYTQRNANDDIDDTQSRPTRKDVKMDKKPSRTRENLDESDDQEERINDSESDEERIDVDNFQDQPLRREDAATKLEGLSKDWKSVDQEVRRHWKVIGQIGLALAESAEDGQTEKELDDLDKIMREFINVSTEMEVHAKVLQNIHQSVVRGEDNSNTLQAYESGVEAELEAYMKKTSRQKYAKQQAYIEFKSGIHEVIRGTPMPPITEFIPKEDGDDSDDDDDLEVGGVTQTYTCPLTLRLLENPMTSMVCAHSFSGDAIKQSFRGAVRSIKCPATGCTKSFKLTDLIEDKDLEKKVKAHKRRQDRAAEYSDAEEVVE
ncbi:hypothetical protein BDQ17DRAFT_1404952 [Cyathus striatus]|nr:hypothetical protein BDQ17DRAFT_1404952 [Cyathus striatus]